MWSTKKNFSAQGGEGEREKKTRKKHQSEPRASSGKA
jgi:hypothetical protein